MKVDDSSHPRIFTGIYPAGIVYADRSREKGGDYARLAFLDYATLTLEIEPDGPADLVSEIRTRASHIQQRRGEPFAVSACGQTVLLGSSL